MSIKILFFVGKRWDFDAIFCYRRKTDNELLRSTGGKKNWNVSYSGTSGLGRRNLTVLRQIFCQNPSPLDSMLMYASRTGSHWPWRNWRAPIDFRHIHHTSLSHHFTLLSRCTHPWLSIDGSKSIDDTGTSHSRESFCWVMKTLSMRHHVRGRWVDVRTRGGMWSGGKKNPGSKNWGEKKNLIFYILIERYHK